MCIAYTWTLMEDVYNTLSTPLSTRRIKSGPVLFFFTLIAGPFYLQCVLVTTKMKRRERFFVFFLWSSFDVNMTIKTQWHIENGGGWGLGGLKRRRNKSKKETTKEIVFHGLAGWRPTQSAWKNICPFKAFTNSYIYAWTLHFGLLMVSWSWKYI